MLHLELLFPLFFSGYVQSVVGSLNSLNFSWKTEREGRAGHERAGAEGSMTRKNKKRKKDPVSGSRTD